MALAARPMVDFGSRMAAIRSVADQLGLAANQTPSQGAANSPRTLLKFVNLCRAAVSLPLYSSMDYSKFVPALNEVAAAAGTAKPENVDTPHMTSNATPPVVGSVLTSTSGNWLNAGGATYTYQWQRNGAAIGANQATYTIVAADLGGKEITCTVTATTAAGAGTPATSNPVVVP